MRGAWAVRRAALTLAAVFAGSVSALAQQGPGVTSRPGQAAGPTSSASLYTHPQRGYTVLLPPNSNYEERAPQGHLHVQSRKGYVFSVQAADTNPSVGFDALFGRLEAQNLGRDRRWTRKISTREARLAGMPAREAVYEGQSTRTRVVLGRGARTDFVVMFFAPPDMYDSLAPEFDWVLDNFRPSPADLAVSAEASMPRKSTVTAPAPPAISPEASPSPAPAPGEARAAAAPSAASPPASKTQLPALTQRFADQALGFTVSYPFDWVAAREGAFAVVFSGREGTAAYRATVSIQNVQPPAAKSPAEAVAAVATDLKRQIENSAAEFRFEAETPIVHGQGQTRLEGLQFLVSYRHAGERFRKWTVVMPRPAGTVAHVWSFAAPQTSFDGFRPIAESMLDSWRIGSGG